MDFYRASICEGGLGSRNSVCPSVCLSVTRVDCDKTKWRTADIFIHILSSVAVDSLISNISILYDVIVSGHKPVSFDTRCVNINYTETSVTVDTDVCSVPVWSNCDDMTLAYYTSYVDKLLPAVCVCSLSHVSCSIRHVTKWTLQTLTNIIMVFVFCKCLIKATTNVIL